MTFYRLVFAAIVLAFITGCTSTEVDPIPSSYDVSHVTIIDNEDVKVPSFLTVLREAFDRHGISTDLAKDSRKSDHPVTSTYTAERSWDLGLYLSHAEVRVWHEGRMIGSATYHLVGKGGLSPFKWQGVETKMKPVLNKLLSEYE